VCVCVCERERERERQRERLRKVELVAVHFRLSVQENARHHRYRNTQIVISMYTIIAAHIY